jgi:hypothetical protein
MRRTISAQSCASVPPAPRVDRHERVAGVVLAGEEPLLLELGQPRLDGREPVVELRGELGVLGDELGEALELSPSAFSSIQVSRRSSCGRTRC